jgi:hypothetical protein
MSLHRTLRDTQGRIKHTVHVAESPKILVGNTEGKQPREIRTQATGCGSVGCIYLVCNTGQ